MRVLHVNTYRTKGGAARAAARISNSIAATGTDCHLLTVHEYEPLPGVEPNYSPCCPLVYNAKTLFAAYLRRFESGLHDSKFSLNLFPSQLVRWINQSDFDIVNLHWISGEILSIEQIGRIEKPLVWTMHDMWPFSGSEHYDDPDNPRRFARGYDKSSRAKGRRGFDFDRWTWQRKAKSWCEKKIAFVGPSNWIAEEARMSPLTKSQLVTTIPNAINTEIFRPIPRAEARKQLGLSSDKKIVLFLAANALADRRKGLDLVVKALERIPRRAGVELLVVGSTGTSADLSTDLDVKFLGPVSGDELLVTIYSAADVFALPSRQDNLPNTAVEALACGTPTVAFDIGGICDIVDTKNDCGALVNFGNTAEFGKELERFLFHPNPENVRTNCRARAFAVFSAPKVASHYIELYRQILAEYDQKKRRR